MLTGSENRQCIEPTVMTCLQHRYEGKPTTLPAANVILRSVYHMAPATQGPHYTTIMKPPLNLPPNMAADSLR